MTRAAIALAGLLVLLAVPVGAATVPPGQRSHQSEPLRYPQNGGGKNSSANYAGYAQANNAAGIYNWNDPYGFVYVQPSLKQERDALHRLRERGTQGDDGCRVRLGRCLQRCGRSPRHRERFRQEPRSSISSE